MEGKDIRCSDQCKEVGVVVISSEKKKQKNKLVCGFVLFV